MNKNDSQVRILLIEGNQDDARFIKRALSASERFSFKLFNAASLESGIEILQKEVIDLIILDLALPDGHGVEALKRLRSEVYNKIVLVISGAYETNQETEILQMGVQDVLLKKDLTEEGLRHSIYHAIDRQKATAELQYRSSHDPLTKVFNRAQFNEILQNELARAKRYQHQFALLFMDLDGFKKVNDQFGHPVGDEVLQAVAKRLRRCLRESDIIARPGGDEFVMLLVEIERPETADFIADKLVKELNHPYVVGEHKVMLSASVGIVCFPGAGNSMESLIKHADVAMYKAKTLGKNRYYRFVPQQHKDC